MAFFTKLRERLTRSSSKIGAGLDDIVGETATAPVAPAAAPEPSGLVGRLFGRAEAQVEEPRRALDDEMLEELEDMLVQADLGDDDRFLSRDAHAFVLFARGALSHGPLPHIHDRSVRPGRPGAMWAADSARDGRDKAPRPFASPNLPSLGRAQS